MCMEKKERNVKSKEKIYVYESDWKNQKEKKERKKRSGKKDMRRMNQVKQK
jgi:hypothetical protein